MITKRIPDNAPQKQLRPRNVIDVAKLAPCPSDIEMAVFSVNSRVSWDDANNRHVKENRNRDTHKIMLRCGVGKFGSILEFNLSVQSVDSESRRLR